MGSVLTQSWLTCIIYILLFGMGEGWYKIGGGVDGMFWHLLAVPVSCHVYLHA